MSAFQFIAIVSVSLALALNAVPNAAPSDAIQKSSGSVQIQLQTKLTYVSGTTIPQQLILNVTYTGSGTATFNLDYSYSDSNWSKIMLILGYTAGAVLILATIVMVVLMWKRSRQDDV